MLVVVVDVVVIGFAVVMVMVVVVVVDVVIGFAVVVVVVVVDAIGFSFGGIVSIFVVVVVPVVVSANGPENLKKSRPKKFMKSNKSISRQFILIKFLFL